MIVKNNFKNGFINSQNEALQELAAKGLVFNI